MSLLPCPARPARRPGPPVCSHPLAASIREHPDGASLLIGGRRLTLAAARGLASYLGNAAECAVGRGQTEVTIWLGGSLQTLSVRAVIESANAVWDAYLGLLGALAGPDDEDEEEDDEGDDKPPEPAAVVRTAG